MVIGFRYLEDKAVGSQESKQATNASGCLSSGCGIEFGARIKSQSEVLVSDSLDPVLASQNQSEDSAVSRTYGVQCPVFASVLDQPLTDWVKNTVRRGCLPYYCERLQITPISRSAYLDSSFQIRNPFSQGERSHYGLAIFLRCAANLEASRIIDGGLDSQNASLLVVHFDRVLIDPMLYTNSFDSLLKFSANFPVEAVTYTTAKKSQHIRTREALDRVSDKRWIQLAQGLLISEHHIGGILTLTDAPVISLKTESRLGFNYRIQSMCKAVEKALPSALGKTVHQLLSCVNIFNVAKAVISFDVLDTSSVHLPRKPFSSVNADLYAKRQPSLQSHMHQSKFTINVVEVNVQTLALFTFQNECFSLAIPPDAKCLTGLDACQHTNKSSSNLASFHDFTSTFLVEEFRGFNVTVRTFMFNCVRFSMCLNTSRKHFYKLPELFVKYPIDRQEYFQSFYVTNRAQRAPEQHSVETCYSTDDAVSMPRQKTLHSSPPVDVFCKTHHAGSWSWSVTHFGCGLTAALWYFASLL